MKVNNLFEQTKKDPSTPPGDSDQSSKKPNVQVYTKDDLQRLVWQRRPEEIQVSDIDNTNQPEDEDDEDLNQPEVFHQDPPPMIQIENDDEDKDEDEDEDEDDENKKESSGGTCKKCKGSGKGKDGKKCKKCGGSGKEGEEGEEGEDGDEQEDLSGYTSSKKGRSVDDAKQGNESEEGEEGEEGKGSGKKGKGQGQGGSGNQGGRKQGGIGDTGLNTGGKTKITKDQLNKHNDTVIEEFSKNQEKTDEEIEQAEREAQERKSGRMTKSGGVNPGTESGSGYDVDYLKIRPSWTWKQILDKFLQTATERFEETYQKMHRRQGAGLDTLVQLGATAVKPGEIPEEHVDAKVAFCIDSSGSMSDNITKVFAEANSLLRNEKFSKLSCGIIKFDAKHIIYKVNFALNKSAQVDSLIEEPTTWTGPADVPFKIHFGGGTVFADDLADGLIDAINHGFNILIISDADMTETNNANNVARVLKAASGTGTKGACFVIVDSLETYRDLRKMLGGVSGNVTCFDNQTRAEQ
jgi:Mg-chelatase subunit ChlD